MREFLFPVLMFIVVMLWACADNFHYQEDEPDVLNIRAGYALTYWLDVENRVCMALTPQGTASISDEKCAELIRKYGTVESP